MRPGSCPPPFCRAEEGALVWGRAPCLGAAAPVWPMPPTEVGLAQAAPASNG